MQTQSPQVQDFKHPVFYVPAEKERVPLIVDETMLRADGVLVGRYSCQTIDQVRVRHPGVQIGELDTIVAETEAMMITTPVEIDEEAFDYALEVLPPRDYATFGACTSFKMCEHLTGRITAVYAQVDGSYYAFNDVYTITHAQIVEKVRAAIQPVAQ